METIPHRSRDNGRRNIIVMNQTKFDFPRLAAGLGGFLLLGLGAWAMVAPESFFNMIALFEPYNAHFIQDIGAFQIGMGVVLLLAGYITSDALTAALLGIGVGALAHVVSHLIGIDAGGNPSVDLPGLSVLAVILLLGGWIRRKQVG